MLNMRKDKVYDGITLGQFNRQEFKEVLIILKGLARQCKICLRYPILHTLESIAKMFRINQIQALFFVYFIRLTDWNIKDQIITANSHQIKDLINYSYDEQEYKNLILYLTLISYSLKQCLTYQNEVFLHVAMKLCSNFQDVFEQWSKKYGDLIQGINPKNINKLYKSIVSEQTKIEMDYIAVVDQIIQISPPYSLTRDQNKLHNMEELKRQANNRIGQGQRLKKKIKSQQNHENQFHATFSDNGLIELLEAGTTNDDYGMENLNRINELGIEMNDRPKRQLIIMPDNVNNSDEDYYEEFNIGNNQPFSEENIIFREFIEGLKPSDLGHGSTYDSPLKFIFQSSQNDGEQQ